MSNLSWPSQAQQLLPVISHTPASEHAVLHGVRADAQFFFSPFDGISNRKPEQGGDAKIEKIALAARGVTGASPWKGTYGKWDPGPSTGARLHRTRH